MKSQIIILVLPLSSLSKIKWLVHGNAACSKESRRLEIGVFESRSGLFLPGRDPSLGRGLAQGGLETECKGS